MSKVLHSWISKLIRSFILLAFFAGSVTGQSKKEQIEVLNLRVDSLKNVVARQNHVNDSLRSLCKMQSNRIDSCLVQITLIKRNLNDSITNYKTALAQKDEANQKLKVQLASLQEVGGQAGPGKSVSFDSSDFWWDFWAKGRCYELTFTPNDTGFTGQFVSYYSSYYSKAYSKNGSRLPYAVGNYVNGLKEGHWVYYLCDGSKQYEGDYVKGIKNGKWINYDFCNHDFRSNIEALFMTIDDNNLTEQDISLLGLYESVNYVNGKRGDTVYYYHKTTKTLQYFRYPDGSFFYSNGQPMTKGSEESGQIIVYFRSGKIASDTKYKLVKNPTDNTVYYERDGEATTYYSNGQIKSKGVFDQGQGVGEWIYYDASGKVTHKGEWLEDVNIGPECPCQ